MCFTVFELFTDFMVVMAWHRKERCPWSESLSLSSMRQIECWSVVSKNRLGVSEGSMEAFLEPGIWKAGRHRISSYLAVRVSKYH